MNLEKIASGRNIRHIMENIKEPIDGIILGTSHAQVGIIPEDLKNGRFVNLALSSQDIYYNYATLRLCLTHYKESFCDLSMIIIDMFDYTYFNYDVSLSREIQNYIRFGGIEDPHNFSSNKNYSFTWDELLRRAYKTKPVPQDRNRTVKDEDIDKFPFDSAIRVKRFDSTIEENTEVFLQLLKLAKDMNPCMNITGLILPRFYKTRELLWEVSDRWREEYMGIIDMARMKYDFSFLVYSRDPLSENPRLFYDSAHLNIAGAKYFTGLLGRDIIK